MRLNAKIRIPKKMTPGLLAAAVAALFLAGEVSYQLYLRSKHEAALAALTAKRQEIAHAKSSGLSLLSADELARLQKRVSAFKRGFVSVSQTAAILDGVSDQAERSNVRVVSVNSGQLTALKGEGGADFEMGGTRYSTLPIKIVIEGDSRSIADFLRAMTVSSDRIFVVDEMTVSKSQTRTGVLTCDLTVSFFSASA